MQVSTAPIFLTWFLVGHVRSLRAVGYEVHAISSSGEELHRFGTLTGATVHPLEMARNIRLGPDIRSLAQFVKLLRSIRPDIVHAHTPKAGMLAMIAAWLLRIPVRIYHCHGLRYETAQGPFRAMLWCAERVACGLATRVLCVSPSLRSALVRARLAREDKVEMLVSGSVGGVDPQRFYPPPPSLRSEARARLRIPDDARVLGFVGRVVRDKGVVELHEAWQSLRLSFPDTHLVIVGPVEDGDPVPPKVIESLRSDPRVRMHGIAEDTLPFYLTMDVVALPSHREGFGVVNLEAAAMGLPTVSTRVNGCIDAVVDGVTGTLVPPHAPAALASALARYLANPALRARHGTAGRARAVAHFRPEAYWASLQASYSRWLGTEPDCQQDEARSPRLERA